MGLVSERAIIAGYPAGTRPIAPGDLAGLLEQTLKRGAANAWFVSVAGDARAGRLKALAMTRKVSPRGLAFFCECDT
jgi:hypothetical protein